MQQQWEKWLLGYWLGSHFVKAEYVQIAGVLLPAVKCPSAEGVLTSCQLLQADRSKEKWPVIFFSREQKMARLNPVYVEEWQERQM